MLWKRGDYRLSPDELAEHFALGIELDEVDRALFLLQEMCNRRLLHNVAFGVTYDSELQLQSPLKRGKKRLGALLPCALPRNLLGALWTQFAESLVGAREHRQCIECGRWIAVSPDARRSHTKYCGKACKAKAYRRRKSGRAPGD